MKYEEIVSEIMKLNKNRLGAILDYDFITKKEFDSQITTINNQINTLNDQTNTINSQVNTLNNQINTINNQVNTLSNQVSTINSQINTLNNQVNTINNQISTINSQITTINNQINTINSRLGFETTTNINSQNQTTYTINVAGNNSISTVEFYNNITNQTLTLYVENNNGNIVISGVWASFIQTSFVRNSTNDVSMTITIPSFIYSITGTLTRIIGRIRVWSSQSLSFTPGGTQISVNWGNIRGARWNIGLNDTYTIGGITNAIYVPMYVGEVIHYVRYNGQSNFINSNFNNINLVGYFGGTLERLFQRNERNIGYRIVLNTHYAKTDAVWMNGNATGWRFKQIWIEEGQNTLQIEEQNYLNFRVLWSNTTTAFDIIISKYKSASGVDIITSRGLHSNPGGGLISIITQRNTFSIPNFQFNTINLNWNTSNTDGSLYLIFERQY